MMKYAQHVEALLFDGAPTQVYRGRTADGRRVILKSLRDASGAAAVASLRHEYTIAQAIQSEHVVRAYALEWDGDRPTLLLEDFGGRSLDHITATRRLTLEEVLSIGFQVADALAVIHDAGVIHKDISPSNIVYNADSGVAKVIDFGISSYLSRENTDPARPALLEGSLRYLSPEQTGRMNRTLDYRTDFYSLGATLYELLTGSHLFDVDEPMAWVHCHIAHQPLAPHQVDAGIPRVVSDVVMKLLSKSADARYQSAAGLREDLSRSLEALRTEGTIEWFDVGEFDLPERFQLPQKLYGRSSEIDHLTSAFHRTSAGPGLVLVGGYSGIGKTSLVKELYRPVTARNGFFVSGKFDPLHRSTPLNAPVLALRDLVRQLLTEPEEQLAIWRKRITSALGDNGGLVCDLIPRLSLIIGPQPPLRALSGQASQRRFNRTLLSFIGVFCREEHPLVMFLDDLQWADSATLNLLEGLLATATLKHLLVVGAYRDNEVHAGHPLTLTMERMRGAGARLEDITLTPLSLHNVGELLSDTFHTDIHSVAPLTALVAQKTGGNPFFIEEFLKDLHHKGLITMDARAGRWRWDAEAIAETQAADNVATLLSEKIMRLSPNTRHILQQAACIGHRFQLRLLMAVCERTWPDMVTALREAMHHGLIIPAGHAGRHLDPEDERGHGDLAFAFAHDRIQQSAHDLLSTSDREQTHLRIARWLLATLSEAQRDDALFRITDHLNTAESLLDGADERRELRELNRASGIRARQEAAYDAAYRYFANALALLEPDVWERESEVALALYADAAAAACVSGRHEICDSLVETALPHTLDPVQAVHLHDTRLQSLIAQGRQDEALQLGKVLLARMGSPYPRQPKRLRLLLEYAVLKWRLRGMTLADLRRLPQSDQHAKVIGLGERIAEAARIAQPTLLPLMVFRGVSAALSAGLSERSILSFSGLSVMLCIQRGLVDEADVYAAFALELCERFPGSGADGRVRLHHTAYVRPWREPVRTLELPLKRAYESCLERGDFDGAALATSTRLDFALLCGSALADMAVLCRDAEITVAALNQKEALEYVRCLAQFVANLRGEADDPAHLKGPHYDIDVRMPRHRQEKSSRLLLAARARQGTLLYSFDRSPEALPWFDALRDEIRVIAPLYEGLSLVYQDALVRLQVARDSRGPQRRRLLREVRWNRRMLSRWATQVPVNALAKQQLVDAEWHWTHGREAQAQVHYDKAIATAREHGLTPEEALANRLCAAMHHAAGRGTICDAYAVRSRDAYRRYGANGLAAFLEQQHPAIVQATVRRMSVSTTTRPSDLDVSALRKALKAIAQEPVHSRMVGTIVTTAMEFAGAQHGVLILRDAKQEMRIEAEASVDTGAPRILQSIPVQSSDSVSHAVVNYVTRTRESVVIDNAQDPAGLIPGLNLDARVQARGVSSLLCQPIIASADQGAELIGMLYLENNRATHSFTEQRFDTLEIIGVAAAGRLELSRKAAVDSLTHLFNRDYFQTMLHQEVVANQRHGRSLSLIMGDIDHFKRFNDTWGHQLGDEVLATVAAAVKDACRESDIVARYGGEELAVILPDTSMAGATVLAERIRAAVAALRIPHRGQHLTVTVSLGVAALTPETAGEQALLRAADAALYKAKADGRNRVQPAGIRNAPQPPGI